MQRPHCPDSDLLARSPIRSSQQCIHWLHSALMKDVGLRIRVQRDLREQFLEVCRAQDKPAAQVIREFMRAYVAKHQTLVTTGEPSPTPTRGSADR